MVELKIIQIDEFATIAARNVSGAIEFVDGINGGCATTISAIRYNGFLVCHTYFQV